MSIGFSQKRHPQSIPERHLWTLRKDGATIEARMRQVELGPERRIYHRAELTWSQVVRGQDFTAFAQERRREYEADGWASASEQPV